MRIFMLKKQTILMAYPFISFIIFIIIFFPNPSLAQTNGSVEAGTTLTADEKSRPWISPSGDFAFGFKQLQDKDLFLLSIWFNKIPDRTVAWYRNSMGPVQRGSTIRVDPDAGLVLLDPKNKELWRTTIIHNQTKTDHAFMNDTGNFILKGTDGFWQWESFKVYADTILPGQELAVGSGLNSRSSETSFSNGNFFLRFRNDGNLVLTGLSVPENTGDGSVYYRSNTSDPGNSSHSGSRAVFDKRGLIYVMRNDNQTVRLSPISVAPISENYYRATLEFDGVFILYSQPRSFTSSSNPSWNVVWSLPDNICASLIQPKGSGVCGYNNICRLENKRPVCDCPKGYVMVDPNNKYGSCKPNYSPTCDEVQRPDDLEILEDSYLDWPESDYQFMNTVNEIDCKQSCLEDCFCAVAVFYDNTCWKKKLPLSNGRRDTSLSSKIFIKTSSSSTPRSLSGGGSKQKKGGTTMSIIGSVLLGIGLFVLLLTGSMCSGFYMMNKKRKPDADSNSTVETNLRCFTFKELTQATRGFKEELGSGSFGVVYKGEVTMNSRNVSVAVKKLNRLALEKEFRAELNSISHTNHKNLVRLLGFCDEDQNRLLVYEYMCNGSLDSLIFSEDKPSWNIRRQIAIGIARGLTYLHEECSIQIIHCDIKPQNILLDDYYNVRISDFGLAKLLDTNQSKASLTNVRGTRGYVAPEWFRYNQITAKVDVYSFGILLLEIISCNKAIEQVGIGEENWGVPLPDLVWDCFQENRLDSFLGNDSEALKDDMMLERFVKAALWCVQENASLRPTMKKVSQMLEGIIEVQKPPCPFPYSSSV